MDGRRYMSPMGGSTDPQSTTSYHSSGQMQLLGKFHGMYRNKLQKLDEDERAGQDTHQARTRILQSYVNDLNQQNEVLVQTLAESEKEANQRVAWLEAKLQKTASAVKEYTTKANEYKREAQAIILERNNAEDRGNNLRRECQLKERCILNLQGEITGLNNKVAAHQSEVTNHVQRNKMMQEKQKDHARQLVHCEDTIRKLNVELQSKLSSSHGHHEILKTELGRRVETIQELRGEVLDLQEKRGHHLAELQYPADPEQLAQKSEETVRAQFADSLTLVASLQKLHNSSKDTGDALTTKSAENHDTILNLRSDVKELEAKQKETLATVNHRGEVIQQVREEVRQAHCRAQETQGRCIRLERELAHSQENYQEAVQDASALHTHIQEMELTANQRDIRHRGLVADNDEQASKLMGKIRIMEERLQQQQTLSREEQLQRAQSELLTHQVRADNEVQKLQIEGAKSREEHHITEDELQRCEARLQQWETDLAVARQQHKDIIEGNKRLEARVQAFAIDAQRKQDLLSAEMKRQEDTIKRLKMGQRQLQQMVSQQGEVHQQTLPESQESGDWGPDKAGMAQCLLCGDTAQMSRAAQAGVPTLKVEGHPEADQLTLTTEQGGAKQQVAARGRTAGQGPVAWTGADPLGTRGGKATTDGTDARTVPPGTPPELELEGKVDPLVRQPPHGPQEVKIREATDAGSLITPVRALGTPVGAVVDTVIVASQELGSQLKRQPMVQETVILEGVAVDSEMEAMMVRVMRLQSRDQEHKWVVYVAPVTDQCILGLDSCTRKNTEGKQFQVRRADIKKRAVPPRMEKSVVVRTTPEATEDLMQPETSHSELLVGGTGRAVIRVRNNTSRNVTLKKVSPMGKAVEVESILESGQVAGWGDLGTWTQQPGPSHKRPTPPDKDDVQTKPTHTESTDAESRGNQETEGSGSETDARGRQWVPPHLEDLRAQSKEQLEEDQTNQLVAQLLRECSEDDYDRDDEELGTMLAKMETLLSTEPTFNTKMGLLASKMLCKLQEVMLKGSIIGRYCGSHSLRQILQNSKTPPSIDRGPDEGEQDLAKEVDVEGLPLLGRSGIEATPTSRLGATEEAGDPQKDDPDLTNPQKMLVVPKDLKEEVLRLSHDTPMAGHFSHENTLARLKQKCTWKGLRGHCHDYTRTSAPLEQPEVGTLHARTDAPVEHAMDLEPKHQQGEDAGHLGVGTIPVGVDTYFLLNRLLDATRQVPGRQGALATLEAHYRTAEGPATNHYLMANVCEAETLPLEGVSPPSQTNRDLTASPEARGPAANQGNQDPVDSPSTRKTRCGRATCRPQHLQG